jgi:hypothetical protein
VNFLDKFVLCAQNIWSQARKRLHIRLELPVMVIVSIVLVIYGFSAAIGSGSIIGWACGIAGLGGFSYLLIVSIRSAMGMRHSFEYFRVIIFFLFCDSWHQYRHRNRNGLSSEL